MSLPPEDSPDLPPVEAVIDPVPPPRLTLIHEPITHEELVELRAGNLARAVRRPVGQGCHCVRYHAPGAYVPAWHHIVPQSWGGPTEPGNLVLICPNTHTATHRLIDEYVRAAGDPGYGVRRFFSTYVRALALHAWERRPEHPTITSLARPA